jgi:hypothetical protein
MTDCDCGLSKEIYGAEGSMASQVEIQSEASRARHAAYVPPRSLLRPVFLTCPLQAP